MKKIEKLLNYYKIYIRQAQICTKKSKKKANKINNKYFTHIETFSLKKTLGYIKKSSSEDKKSHINLNFSNDKKFISPLTFVKEYNRLRNRRRRNIKIITKNLGFKIEPKIETKDNKVKSYFGLSFNVNKYY